MVKWTVQLSELLSNDVFDCFFFRGFFFLMLCDAMILMLFLLNDTKVLFCLFTYFDVFFHHLLLFGVLCRSSFSSLILSSTAVLFWQACQWIFHFAYQIFQLCHFCTFLISDLTFSCEFLFLGSICDDPVIWQGSTSFSQYIWGLSTFSPTRDLERMGFRLMTRDSLFPNNTYIRPKEELG